MHYWTEFEVSHLIKNTISNLFLYLWLWKILLYLESNLFTKFCLCCFWQEFAFKYIYYNVIFLLRACTAEFTLQQSSDVCCCSYLHASVLNNKYPFLQYICSINNMTQYTIDFVKGSKYIYNTFLNDAKYRLNIVIGKIPKNIEILFCVNIARTPLVVGLLFLHRQDLWAGLTYRLGVECLSHNFN